MPAYLDGSDITSREFDAELVLDIYTAATQRSAWLSVVDRLAQAVDSAGCILLLSDTDAEVPWTISAGSELWRGWPPEKLVHYQRYLSHHEAPAFAALREFPEQVFKGTWDEDARFRCPNDREDARYLIEYAGVHHRAAARLNGNAAWYYSVAFQFGAGTEPVSHDRLERVRPYLPHVAKTLEFGRLYERLFRLHAAVLTALDHVRIGMAIVSATGDVIVANTAAQAILDRGDGVRRDASGRIALVDNDAHRHLRSCCATLALTAAGAPGDPARQLTVPLDDTRLPLLIEVTPLRDGLAELDRSLAAVMVMIIDPQSDRSVDTARLALACGLSGAESDVCRLLVLGLGMPAIAAHRSTSVDTVKTQISQVYRKAGVVGRTALVRLAVRMDPVVD